MFKQMSQLCVVAIALVAVGLLIAPANAAMIGVGDKIGVDFGTATTATNWNNFTTRATIASGSVTNLAGTTLDNVSITVATANDGGFFGPGTSN